MSLNQRVTAEFSTCTPSAPPTADLSIQTDRMEPTVSLLESATNRTPTAQAIPYSRRGADSRVSRFPTSPLIQSCRRASSLPRAL